MTKLKSIAITILIPALTLAGCANTGAGYRPIVDAPDTPEYRTDLGECQELAKTRRYDNGKTKTAGLLGALGGALIGAIEGDSVGDALAGAAVGGILGSAVGAGETHGERKQIVINCMAGRGHRVVG